MFGLRMGINPQVVITTTPRPIKLFSSIAKDSGTHLQRGSLYENAGNLASSFVAKIVARYEGTRLGRQEIDGELLEDVPGALWTRGMVEAARYPLDPTKPVSEQMPLLRRVVVALDPAVTSGEDSDDTGIVVAGVGRGLDGRDVAYVLADDTCHESPDAWARRAVKNYREYRADRVIGEVNNGGDMVETTVRAVDPHVPYKAVHASRGKRVRAEPVSALYEQGRVKHIGAFPDLEDQMCNFVPDMVEKSPDRLDALVWAITELMLQEPEIVRRTVRLATRVTI
jgi:phage terminase large subunit-like protein